MLPKTPIVASFLLLGAAQIPFQAQSSGLAKEVQFRVTISSVSKDDALAIPGGAVRAPIAPGVFLVDPTAVIASPGERASPELERLAEDGNYEPLQQKLASQFGARSGMFVPGQEFTVVAKPGDRLSFATMFVQSNDKFYGAGTQGIALFKADESPVAGNLTPEARLYDAGTEMDEQPGVGPNQAPRQEGPNKGSNQWQTVGEADDGFAYPPVRDVIEVTIRPVNGAGL
jgi:hypothetical protein